MTVRLVVIPDVSEPSAVRTTLPLNIHVTFGEPGDATTVQTREYTSPAIGIPDSVTVMLYVSIWKKVCDWCAHNSLKFTLHTHEVNGIQCILTPQNLNLSQLQLMMIVESTQAVENVLHHAKVKRFDLPYHADLPWHVSPMSSQQSPMS